MEHQDWNTIIMRPKKKENNKEKKQYVKSDEQKMNENIENGKLSHKKMDIEFGKNLQKLRLSKNMTQKDLALKLNVPVKDINEIESGKAKHNGQLMSKIKRIFNEKK